MVGLLLLWESTTGHGGGYYRIVHVAAGSIIDTKVEEITEVYSAGSRCVGQGTVRRKHIWHKTASPLKVRRGIAETTCRVTGERMFAPKYFQGQLKKMKRASRARNVRSELGKQQVT